MPRSPAIQEYTTSLRVYNAHASPITLYLEPWGEQYTKCLRKPHLSL